VQRGFRGGPGVRAFEGGADKNLLSTRLRGKGDARWRFIYRERKGETKRGNGRRDELQWRKHLQEGGVLSARSMEGDSRRGGACILTQGERKREILPGGGGRSQGARCLERKKRTKWTGRWGPRRCGEGPYSPNAIMLSQTMVRKRRRLDRTWSTCERGKKERGVMVRLTNWLCDRFLLQESKEKKH